MINVKEQREIAKQLGVKRFSTMKIDKLRMAIDDRKKEFIKKTSKRT